MNRLLPLFAAVAVLSLGACKHAEPADAKPARGLRGLSGNGRIHVVKTTGQDVQGAIVDVKDPDFTILEQDGSSSKLPITRVHRVKALPGQVAKITPKAGGPEASYPLWSFELSDGSTKALAVTSWPSFAVDQGRGNVDRTPIFDDKLSVVEVPEQ